MRRRDAVRGWEPRSKTVPVLRRPGSGHTVVGHLACLRGVASYRTWRAEVCALFDEPGLYWRSGRRLTVGELVVTRRTACLDLLLMLLNGKDEVLFAPAIGQVLYFLVLEARVA